MKTNNDFVLLRHGGVGTILNESMTPEREAAYLQTLERALVAWDQSLLSNGGVVETVEAAVLVMEDSPLFNAGQDSVFFHDGKQEMDASILD